MNTLDVTKTFMYRSFEHEFYIHDDLRKRYPRPSKLHKLKVDGTVEVCGLDGSDIPATLTEDGKVILRAAAVSVCGELRVVGWLWWLVPVMESRPHLYKRSYNTILMPFGEYDRVPDGYAKSHEIRDDEISEYEGDDDYRVQWDDVVVGYQPPSKSPCYEVSCEMMYQLWPMNETDLSQQFDDHRTRTTFGRHSEVIRDIFVEATEDMRCRLVLNCEGHELPYCKSRHGFYIDFTTNDSPDEHWLKSLAKMSQCARFPQPGLHTSRFQEFYLDIWGGQSSAHRVEYNCTVLLNTIS